MEQMTVMVLQPREYASGIRGSITIEAGCGHQAWISPSGKATLASSPIPTVCLNCLPPGPFEARTAPGGRDELAAHVGEEAADQSIAVVTAFGKIRSTES